jgi:endo-1,4-beta-mannosidase
MWEAARFDEATVAAEFAAARAMGLDCLRTFAFAPTFMPSPPAVDKDALARYARMLALAADAGLEVLSTPLVGHMSGENWDFPGQAGRSIWRDPEVLAWEEALVTELAALPALGVVLSNEGPLWGGSATPAELSAWAERMARAARAAGAKAVGAGDGCMGGFPSSAFFPHVDWIGPHVYGGDVDPARAAVRIDFAIARETWRGKPVLLEEYGASVNQAGAAEHAAYVRESTLSALGLGAVGAVIWCLTDFDAATLGSEPPYSHHAFELGFGLLDATGRPKPAAEELVALRRLVDGIDLAAMRPPTPRVAIVRSSFLDEGVPFSWDDRGALGRVLHQAYTLAVQAGLDPVVVDEEADLTPYRLILCPATQKLWTPTWRRLAEAARAGATVYWSWSSGEYSFHQGAWCANFEELTGCVHHLRYGCFELPGERVRLRGEVALDIPTRLQAARSLEALARLPIAARPGAPVTELAVDDGGRPALVAHALGAGQVVFSPYPLERYLADLPDGSARDAHRLYRLLADEAGVEPEYPTRHPDVTARVLRGDGEDVVIVQHRGWRAEVDDAVEIPRDAALVYDRGNPRGGAFGPKGARVYRVKR